jgi:ribosomal protein S18 acetylase RimI-like enzyme
MAGRFPCNRGRIIAQGEVLLSGGALLSIKLSGKLFIIKKGDLMLEIIQADLSHPQHAEAVVYLLNQYALDPMGGHEALSSFAQANLIAELKKRSTVHIALAFSDGAPAALAICMEGFSTFACQPLLNIHDFAVHPDFRGQGISKLMMAKVIEIARGLACCKITLEVLEGNAPAYSLYKAVGFVNFELDPKLGHASMMQLKLV